MTIMSLAAACTAVFAQDVMSKGREAPVSCQAMEIAISGGARCGKEDPKGSRPLATGASPNGWEVSCGQSVQHTAYAVCCTE